MSVAEGFRPRSVAFLGTPAIAMAPLRALVEAGPEVTVVVTAPDKRRGRGSGLVPSPVKAEAERLGLPVAHDVDALVRADGSPVADLGVVVAYGRILRPETLAVMPFVNLHFSLLPRWRGAAPVERAILAGDAETGVALMAIEEGLDTGAVYGERRTDVGDKSLAELWDELSVAGAEMLVDAVNNGFPTARPQTGEATHAAKLARDERAIDWTRPRDQVLRTIRLGDAWATVDGRRLKVWEARASANTAMAAGEIDGSHVGCADGAIELLEVQPEGKGRTDAEAWSRGRRP